MSDTTKANLDAALAAHISDVTDGNVLTDWALMAASTDMEDIGTGRTNYFFEANQGQPVHVSYGLLSYALNSSLWHEDSED